MQKQTSNLVIKKLKEVLVKCRLDILGIDSTILKRTDPNSKYHSVKPCHYKDGTIEHLKHYEAEYERVKELADNATGETANRLYQELDGIKLILDSYTP